MQHGIGRKKKGPKNKRARKKLVQERWGGWYFIKKIPKPQHTWETITRHSYRNTLRHSRT